MQSLDIYSKMSFRIENGIRMDHPDVVPSAAAAAAAQELESGCFADRMPMSSLCQCRSSNSPAKDLFYKANFPIYRVGSFSLLFHKKLLHTNKINYSYTKKNISI